MFRLWAKEFKDNRMLLDSNIDEFKRHAKTRFHQDNFVDSIEFDYLEIHIIEE